MKTTLSILIFTIGLFYPCFGQVLEINKEQSPQELYEYHMTKKIKNATAGIVSLVAGAGLITAGISTNIDNCLISGCNNGMPLVYLGTGIGLSSFVWFSKASKHKKVAKLQLQNGAVGFNRKFKYTGVSITFSL